jgi:PIN domain nuclease of toxin-antitoxin system
MAILLDTNALMWSETRDPRLGPVAAKLIVASAPKGDVFISPISFWELECAVLRKRATLAQPMDVWRQELFARGYRERSTTGEDAILAARLDDVHKDPADRLIVAVALNADLTLLTSDRKILDWSGLLQRPLQRMDTRL